MEFFNGIIEILNYFWYLFRVFLQATIAVAIFLVPLVFLWRKFFFWFDKKYGWGFCNC